jgi:hypothetical protein
VRVRQGLLDIEAGAGQKNRKSDATFAGQILAIMLHEHNQLAVCGGLKERKVAYPEITC